MDWQLYQPSLNTYWGQIQCNLCILMLNYWILLLLQLMRVLRVLNKLLLVFVTYHDYFVSLVLLYKIKSLLIRQLHCLRLMRIQHLWLLLAVSQHEVSIFRVANLLCLIEV